MLAGSLSLRFDLLRRRPDRVDAFCARAQQRIEHCVITAFVFSAENNVQIRRERFERFDGGVNVCRFGIVVVGDAIRWSQRYSRRCSTALNSLTAREHLRLASCEHGDRNRRQHIFHVVRAFRLMSFSRQDFLFAPPSAKRCLPPRTKAPLPARSSSAEPINLRSHFRGKFHAGRVVGVEDGEIILRLVLEYSRFRRRVCNETAVAIQVVRRDVEDGGDLRAECLDCFELETGDLKHVPCLQIDAAIMSVTGVPMFPPTCVGNPDFDSISPTAML